MTKSEREKRKGKGKRETRCAQASVSRVNDKAKCEVCVTDFSGDSSTSTCSRRVFLKDDNSSSSSSSPFTRGQTVFAVVLLFLVSVSPPVCFSVQWFIVEKQPLQSRQTLCTTHHRPKVQTVCVGDRRYHQRFACVFTRSLPLLTASLLV